MLKVIYWMDQKRENRQEIDIKVNPGLSFREKVEVAHDYLLLNVGFYWEMKIQDT